MRSKGGMAKTENQQAARRENIKKGKTTNPSNGTLILLTECLVEVRGEKE